MSTKKKTSKPVKTIIAKMPKIPAFDLSFSKPDENVKIMAALESLKTNSGWMFLTQVFQGNIKYLANQIISKTTDTGQVLSDADIDILRFKHAYLTELLDKPDAFLKQFSRVDEKEDDLDPYERGKNG